MCCILQKNPKNFEGLKVKKIANHADENKLNVVRSLKVWRSTSFKENFVESMANVNVNGIRSFHEFHEFQRRFR